jgi:hypothetical protein
MPTILKSKKFLTALAAMLAVLIGNLIDAPPEEVSAVVLPLLLYIFAQGVADFGKERARIENSPEALARSFPVKIESMDGYEISDADVVNAIKRNASRVGKVISDADQKGGVEEGTSSRSGRSTLAASIMIFLTLTISVGAVGVSGCIAPAVDDAVLLQSTLGPWESITFDYVMGVDDALAKGEITQEEYGELYQNGYRVLNALNKTDPLGFLSVDWVLIEHYAYRGIDAQLETGVVSPGAADSLREQVRLFVEVVKVLKTNSPLGGE